WQRPSQPSQCPPQPHHPNTYRTPHFSSQTPYDYRCHRLARFDARQSAAPANLSWRKNNHRRRSCRDVGQVGTLGGLGYDGRPFFEDLMAAMTDLQAIRIKGQIQAYQWGGRAFLPALLGVANEDALPQAEYWLGAHPSARAVTLSERKIGR